MSDFLKVVIMALCLTMSGKSFGNDHRGTHPVKNTHV